MRRRWWIALCLGLAGCGIKGDPSPPIVKAAPQATLPATEQ